MLAGATLVAVYRCLGRSRKDHAQLRQKILCLGLFPGLIGSAKPKTQKLERDVHVIVTARRVFAFPSTSGLYAFKQPGYTHYRDCLPRHLELSTYRKMHFAPTPQSVT
jgi:hypothetical protein